jgi:tetratricopeptide (TPR) repeat protein
MVKLKKILFNFLSMPFRYRFFKGLIIALVALPALAETIDLATLVKEKKFEKIVFHFRTKTSPKSYKDYGYLILAYKNLDQLNNLVTTIEDALKLFPDKDVLKRELALAYEQKSMTYTDKKMANLKQEYYIKALTVLEDLKNTKPTAINLTAFIHFHLRNQKYNEVEALLDLYSRSYPKGETYYSLLCEVQFEKKLYSEAVQSCEQIKDKRDMALLRYVKSKEQVEKINPDSDSLLSMSSRFPASPIVHLEIGKRLLSEGNFEKSIFHLNKANRLEPTSEGFRMIAESHFGVKDYATSLDYFRKACKIETGSKSHIHNKIRLLSKKMPKSSDVYNDFQLEISRCKHVR